MTDYPIHDENTAPEASRETLRTIKGAFGFIPNALGILAASNPALSGYLALDAKVAETSLSDAQVQSLILAISHENACHYCMAAHSAQAGMAGVAEKDIETLRQGQSPSDPKLRALITFGRSMVKKRGWLEQHEIDDFLAAGFTQANVFDVILVVAMKTITNYSNHITQAPVDEAFTQYRWSAKESVEAAE